MIGRVGRPGFLKDDDLGGGIVREPLAMDYHTSPLCSNFEQCCTVRAACQLRSWRGGTDR